jgi:phosphopantetheinyl transferase (holo-ACP synthase)
MIQIGHDLLEIERFYTLIYLSPYKIQRLFLDNQKELTLEKMAGIFCLKEAVFKAISNIINVTPLQVTVDYEINGRPLAKIDSVHLAKFHYISIDVSLTNTKNLISSIAIVSYDLIP